MKWSEVHQNPSRQSVTLRLETILILLLQVVTAAWWWCGSRGWVVAQIKYRLQHGHFEKTAHGWARYLNGCQSGLGGFFFFLVFFICLREWLINLWTISPHSIPPIYWHVGVDCFWLTAGLLPHAAHMPLWKTEWWMIKIPNLLFLEDDIAQILLTKRGTQGATCIAPKLFSRPAGVWPHL